MFKATQTQCGQYARYGDFFREWDIETNMPKEEVLEECFESLYQGKKVPSSEEWLANIRYGGEKSGDMNYYFAGYYTMKETETGYHFTICEPFAD